MWAQQPYSSVVRTPAIRRADGSWSEVAVHPSRQTSKNSRRPACGIPGSLIALHTSLYLRIQLQTARNVVPQETGAHHSVADGRQRNFRPCPRCGDVKPLAYSSTSVTPSPRGRQLEGRTGERTTASVLCKSFFETSKVLKDETKSRFCES